MAKLVKVRDGNTFIIIDVDKIICAWGRSDGHCDISLPGTVYDDIDISIEELADIIIPIDKRNESTENNEFKNIYLVDVNNIKSSENLFKRNYYKNGIHAGFIIYDSNCLISETVDNMFLNISK